MNDPAALPVRVARTALLALVAIGLGASGHTLAGHPVSPAALLATALIVTPLLAWLSERTWQPGRLTLALGGVQVLAHLALSAAAGAAHSASGLTLGSHLDGHGLTGAGLPGQGVAGLGLATVPPVAVTSTSAAAGGTAFLTTLAQTLTPTMILGHAVATVITAVVLARLDAAVAAVTAFLSPMRPGAVRLPMVARPLRVGTDRRTLASQVPPSPRSSRGPPPGRRSLAFS